MATKTHRSAVPCDLEKEAVSVFWDGYRSAFSHGGPSDEQDYEEAVAEGVAAVIALVKANDEPEPF
jgi:hypothetical protein